MTSHLHPERKPSRAILEFLAAALVSDSWGYCAAPARLLAEPQSRNHTCTEFYTPAWNVHVHVALYSTARPYTLYVYPTPTLLPSWSDGGRIVHGSHKQPWYTAHPRMSAPPWSHQTRILIRRYITFSQRGCWSDPVYAHNTPFLLGWSTCHGNTFKLQLMIKCRMI